MKKWFKDHTVERGKIKGIDYYIAKSPRMLKEETGEEQYEYEERGGLNGYLVFPKCPIVYKQEQLFSIVKVHGNITLNYFEKGLGYVVGFDTCHNKSYTCPTRDIKWIKKETEKMLNSILILAKFSETLKKCIDKTLSNVDCKLLEITFDELEGSILNEN